MQARRRRRDRAFFWRIHRLIAFFVGRLRGTGNVRRQRQAAVAFDQLRRIAGESQPVELALASQHLDIERVFEPQATARLRRLARPQLRQRGGMIEQALDQDFDPAAAFLVPEQAGVQHPAVIQHQQVACAQPQRQIDEVAVLVPLALHHQQAACRALRQGRLGDQFGGQRVVEIGKCQGHRQGWKSAWQQVNACTSREAFDGHSGGPPEW